MNSEVEDCLIRLENQMYGFGGVAGRSASGDRYEVEEHIRDIEGYERDTRRDVVQKDARIAELTAEVASLRLALDKVSARAEQGRHEEDFEAIDSIARNALKDGV